MAGHPLSVENPTQLVRVTYGRLYSDAVFPVLAVVQSAYFQGHRLGPSARQFTDSPAKGNTEATASLEL